MKPINSVITTLHEEQHSKTGTPRGGLGLATPASSPEVAAWLATKSPADVDQAAVLRASRLGVELSVKCDYRFPKDERGNSLPVVRIVKGCDVMGTPEARQAAIEALEKLEAPADARGVEAWLAELSVIVAKRQEDEFTESLRLEAYASRLRQYPADVARAAVLDHPWKFWPAWAELEAVCNQLVAPRRAMLSAMKASERHAYEENRKRVTRDEAERIMREVWGDE